MFETDQLEGLLPEDIHDSHLTTTNKSSLQQYKLSLHRYLLISHVQIKVTKK